MLSSVFALGHNGPHQVARLETMSHLLMSAMPNRKTIGICPAHLPVAVSSGNDRQRSLIGTQFHPLAALSYTSSVNPVCFGIVLLCAVEFGSPTCANFNGKSAGFQNPKENPTGCIDGCCIFEGYFGLSLEVRIAKLRRSLCAFVEVTVLTG